MEFGQNDTRRWIFGIEISAREFASLFKYLYPKEFAEFISSHPMSFWDMIAVEERFERGADRKLVNRKFMGMEVYTGSVDMEFRDSESIVIGFVCSSQPDIDVEYPKFKKIRNHPDFPEEWKDRTLSVYFINNN